MYEVTHHKSRQWTSQLNKIPKAQMHIYEKLNKKDKEDEKKRGTMRWVKSQIPSGLSKKSSETLSCFRQSVSAFKSLINEPTQVLPHISSHHPNLSSVPPQF